MLDYEQAALDQVNAALATYGQTLVWTKNVDGSPADSNKPWLPGTEVQTAFTTLGLILPSNRKALSAIMFMQGVEVPDGYQRGLLPGNCGFTPTLKDSFVDSAGTTYSLEWLDVLKPAGNPLLWFLGLRPSA